jgi:hypothetical protein
MNIQHIFPKSDPLIAEHVKMLNGEGCADGELVHVHGCWNYHVVKRALQAHRRGARIVFTPHGGLEPWVIHERRVSEKLVKTLLWQRRLVESAYVIIAHGNMESDALQQLGWNPRIEIIRNAVVTNSITPEAMMQHTEEIYRKVMDSNTLELMSDDARLLLRLLLKAGITGDGRWINERVPSISEKEWRWLLIYADHEHVRTTVDSGIRVLGIHSPFIATHEVKSYLPTNYKLPQAKAHDVAGIVSEMRRQPITLHHFVCLDKLLRRDDIQDDWLCDALDENHLLKFFRRLLQVQTEVTGLDEGFLPANPINDRGTQRIRKRLANHLRI